MKTKSGIYDRQHSAKGLIGRFLPYYKPYIRTMVFDLFCAGLTCIAELTLPQIIKYLTNTAVNDIAALTIKTVLSLGCLYLVLRAIDAAAAFFMAYQGHVMGTKMETDMRRDAYDHLLRLSDTYYSNTKIGQIMGRITNDLFDVTEFAHHCPEEFFIAAVKLVASFVILSKTSFLLTLLVFAVVPIMVPICLKVNFKMRDAFAMQRHQTGELNARIEDSLLGQKVVKAFTNEPLEREKFKEDNMKFFGIKKLSYKYMATFQLTVRIFEGVMYLVVLLGGGIFLLKGLISAGDMVAYVMYVSTLIATVRRIVEFAEQFQRGMTGIDRFLGIMDSDIEIFDEPGARELKNAGGEIHFDNVGFSYPDDGNTVFTSLNLTIHKGERLAIVGPSGGGKTTLCNLIPRFYNIDSGKIYLDGEDIKSYTLKSLRENIGMVQQDVYLFSGSVYDNIIYGRPDATYEEVIEAAKKAGAHEFISALKDGYNTYIGERGVKLSGGQKQRISIARVFLKDPPILILDEATSALDNDSEYEVAKSLRSLSNGRTTLTIAHRLSSIVNSDRILVLTKDGIVEEGNHAELMEKRGIYYGFYTRTSEVK
ncbi:MAG: ABC transporter ATP-binding protein [Oscillospiraceae bacterium]|nr:ABC transporter ATP-binding protein [Oscillospiraceae bacterium]